MSAVSTMGRQKSSHPFNPSLSLSLFLSSFFPPLGLALFHRYSRSTSGKLIAAAYKAYHPSSSSSSLFPPSSSFPSLPALRLFSPFYLLFFFLENSTSGIAKVSSDFFFFFLLLVLFYFRLAARLFFLFPYSGDARIFFFYSIKMIEVFQGD